MAVRSSPPSSIIAAAGVEPRHVAGAGRRRRIGWIAALLGLGSRRGVNVGHKMPIGAGTEDDGLPVLRRADAHPDAPARRPLRADRDFGVPFPPVLPTTRTFDVAGVTAPAVRSAPTVAPAPERALPTDLDEPLFAYDSGAFLGVRPKTFALGERFETFLPMPMGSAISAPKVDPSVTIHALLDRVEHVVQDRPVPRPQDKIANTLTALRDLARRAQ